MNCVQKDDMQKIYPVMRECVIGYMGAKDLGIVKAVGSQSKSAAIQKVHFQCKANFSRLCRKILERCGAALVDIAVQNWKN